MLLVLLYWFLIVLTAMAVGRLILALSGNLPKNLAGDTQQPGFALVLLSGLVGLATIGNVLSFFTALDGLVRPALQLLTISTLLWRPSRWITWLSREIQAWMAWPWYSRLALALLFITALIKTVGPSDYEDEPGYHLPAIRWMENFPVIPGLGNVEDRLGFNANTNPLHALFSQQSWMEGGLYDLNSLLFVVLGGWLISRFNQWMAGEKAYLYSAALGVMSLVFAFRSYLASMNPDIAIIFGQLLLLVLILGRLEKGKNSLSDFEIWFSMIWFTFLVSCKFSTALLAPVILWPLLEQWSEKKYRQVTAAVISALVILLPWLWRNYYLSGYLVYPVYFLDLFDVDWKVPADIARGQFHYVGAYAKIMDAQFCRYPEYQLTFRDWFPVWFGYQRTQLIGLVMLAGIPFSFVAMTLVAIRTIRSRIRQDLPLVLVCAYLGLLSLVWLLRIPATRFGWAWVLGFLILASWLLVRPLLHRHERSYRLFLSGFLLVVCLRHAVTSVADNPVFYRQWLRPAPVAILEPFEWIELNGQRLKLSFDMMCRGAIPPCLPDCYDRRLQLRTGHIRDGFYIPDQNQ